MHFYQCRSQFFMSLTTDGKRAVLLTSKVSMKHGSYMVSQVQHTVTRLESTLKVVLTHSE